MMPFDHAITVLQTSPDPHERIINSSAYWIPLQWLYVRMVENKYLIPLSEISKEQKERYWNLSSVKKEQWSRICICQALYVYENI